MDLSNVLNGVTPQEDNNREMSALPAGDYDVKIEAVDGKKNEQTGSAGISMKMRVYGDKFNNYCLFDYMLIKGSEAGLKWSLPKLKKLAMILSGEDTNTWVGKSVRVNVSVDKNDATKNIVWRYMEASQVDNTPMTNNTSANITANDLPF